jgi:mono/diheme cytochrome c family protein
MAKFLVLVGFLGILGAIVAGFYFFGGFYSVAAVDPDHWIVERLLIQVRQASIARHAKDSPPAESPTDVQAGARAYATRGCVNCHGAPGGEWAKWSEGLQPSPADLKETVGERQPKELFWVIKNGIKMTGMPSFATAGVPDDEIWKIVVFLKKWPSIKPEEYKAWTAPAAPATPPATPPTTQPPG